MSFDGAIMNSRSSIFPSLWYILLILKWYRIKEVAKVEKLEKFTFSEHMCVTAITFETATRKAVVFMQISFCKINFELSWINSDKNQPSHFLKSHPNYFWLRRYKWNIYTDERDSKWLTNHLLNFCITIQLDSDSDSESISFNLLDVNWWTALQFRLIFFPARYGFKHGSQSFWTSWGL